MIQSLIDRVKSHHGAWDEAFRLALARHEYAKVCADHPDYCTPEAEAAIASECDLEAGAVTWEWWEDLQAKHIEGCRERGGKAAHEIERLTLQVQSVSDHLKALKSAGRLAA